MDQFRQKFHKLSVLLGASITLAISAFLLFWGIQFFRVIYPDAYSLAVLGRGDSSTIGPVERWMLICRKEWLICIVLFILAIFVIVSLGSIVTTLYRRDDHG